MKRGAWQHVNSLLLINFIFLVYNIIWAFTLIQMESITYFLYSDVFSLGTYGLIIFHIMSIIVLWIFFYLTDHSEQAASIDEGPIQIPDHPTKLCLFIFRILHFALLALYILRWSCLYFEVLETTAILVQFQILAFLVIGIISVGQKIWLVWKFIVNPNVPLLTDEYKVKHLPRAVLLALTMISSLVVIVHLGKDRYDLWQPLQQAMLFQFFLGVYVVAHMLLVLFEGWYRTVYVGVCAFFCMMW